ncbi:hypothetical protein JXL19_08250 [bacterium]|nr:hypothetical protein [bacterium]
MMKCLLSIVSRIVIDIFMAILRWLISTAIISIILHLGFLYPSWAITPEIYSVNPVTGIDAEQTQVTIKGTGFQQTPDVSLYGWPYITGTYDTPDYSWAVCVSGNYAYVADDYSGLHVIDISDPCHPSINGSCDTPGYAEGVYVSGNYAYVADGESGLQVIDISDPCHPSIKGSCSTEDYAWGIYVSGDHAYVADGFSGLQVIDISDPCHPYITGLCNTQDYSWGVCVSGNYAYVADGDSGLQVIDISDPCHPYITGSCDTQDYAVGVCVSGNYAYVADWEAGLQVIDISDPCHPSITSTCETPGYAEGVYVLKNYAYVADGESGLQVIDISDPCHPSITGSCKTQDYAIGVYVSGNYAYVADGEAGLQVIKLFYSPGDVYYIDSNTLYVTIPEGYHTGIYDLHVSNPDGGYAVLKNAFSVYHDYYRDSDGDGYGNAGNFIAAFSAPAGYVSDDTDCDDNDPNTYKGAPELIDGKDNDCDSFIDENDYTYYYPLSEGWNLISYQIKVCMYEGESPAKAPNLFIIDPNEIEFIHKQTLKGWLMDDTNSPIRDATDPNKAGNWQRIISFDHEGAHLLDKDLPDFINTLHYLSLGYGYWIKMNRDGYLIMQGQPAIADICLNLKTGWNLMGFIPPDVCYAKDPNVLTQICPYQTGIYQQEEGIAFCPVDPFPLAPLVSISGKYQRIISFDTCDGAKLFDKDLPDFINTLDYIGPKYGYWIKMLEDGDLVFPDGCP